MLDVPYPDFLCGLQLPEHLRYVCATAGFQEPDLYNEFTYCDLGCGQGRTAAAIAALHPQAKVWGLDLSDDHIRTARAFADRADLTNVTFLVADLSTFDPSSLPPLDFIAMHGVWAWIPEQVRAGILRLIMQRLKPGGLCYVSYNAMPGAVSLGAIRRMCLDLLGGEPTDQPKISLPKALQQLRRIADANGLFFQKHPIAEKVIATADKADLRYMAHEYLADQWEPMSIKEVADTMRGAGLTWASSCILAHRLHHAGLPDGLLQEIEKEDDKIRREVLADIALNRQFRADVFIKSTVCKPRPNRLEEFTFSLTTMRQAVPQRVAAEGIEIDTSLAPIPLILDALAEGSLSFSQLARMEALSIDATDLAEVLMALVVVDVIKPLPKSGAKRKSLMLESQGAKFHAFNKAALAAKYPGQPVTMIAPALGGIVSIPPIDVALIETFLENEGHVDAAGLIENLNRSQMSFSASPDETDRKAQAAIGRFKDETLPKLLRLGMLQ